MNAAPFLIVLYVLSLACILVGLREAQRGDYGTAAIMALSALTIHGFLAWGLHG